MMNENKTQSAKIEDLIQQGHEAYSWLERIIAAESIALYLLAATYAWITPSYSASVLGRTAFIILLIGTACIVCCAIIGSIEGWYPKLECIKDDEMEP